MVSRSLTFGPFVELWDTTIRLKQLPRSRARPYMGLRDAPTRLLLELGKLRSDRH